MTSFEAVSIAWVLQLIFGISLFIHPEDIAQSPASALSSWLFLTGLLDFVMDFELYPVCYMHLPDIVRLVWETLCAILLAEVGNLIVWGEIENVLSQLTEMIVRGLGASEDFYKSCEHSLVTGITMLVAGSFLIAALYATDDLYILKKKWCRLEKFLYCKYDQLYRKWFPPKCEPPRPQCPPKKPRRKPHCSSCDFGNYYK